MGTRQLKALLRLLRSEGVTRYTDGPLSVELGAAKPDKQDKQRKEFPPGPDTGALDDAAPSAPAEEEITDPRVWLEARYRGEAKQ